MYIKINKNKDIDQLQSIKYFINSNQFNINAHFIRFIIDYFWLIWSDVQTKFVKTSRQETRELNVVKRRSLVFFRVGLPQCMQAMLNLSRPGLQACGNEVDGVKLRYKLDHRGKAQCWPKTGV